MSKMNWLIVGVVLTTGLVIGITSYYQPPRQTIESKTQLQSSADKSRPPLETRTKTETQESVKTETQPPPPAPPRIDVYPEVWSKNGYDGASYEFKTNCGSGYDKLETCFLWEATRVAVTDPSSKIYELNKDFNQNAYSGEITRRWVLYGPAGAGLPAAGNYTFNYYKDDALALTQNVSYAPSAVEAPTNITWQKQGNDLAVAWQPPSGMTDKMWYKVIVFRKDGQVLSQTVKWDAASDILKDFPLDSAEEADMNVSSYFPGGYAYPASVKIVW